MRLILAAVLLAVLMLVPMACQTSPARPQEGLQAVFVGSAGVYARFGPSKLLAATANPICAIHLGLRPESSCNPTAYPHGTELQPTMPSPPGKPCTAARPAATHQQ